MLHDSFPVYHFSSSLTISSKLFLFVSGKQIKMNKAPMIELQANKNIVPCIPMTSMKVAKYWEEKNERKKFAKIYNKSLLWER